MDWNRAVERNSEALGKIVAALFAMLSAAAFSPLPRGGRGASRSEVERESHGDAGAALFTLPRHIYAAIMLVLRPAESAVRRIILMAAKGLVLKPRNSRPLPAGFGGFAGAGDANTPAFCLIDPLKHFPLDAFDNNALPHFVFHSGSEAEFQAPAHVPPDGPIDAAQLFTRLRAIRAALADIPRQARRLARWQARRNLLRKAGRCTRVSIFRPGLPPGWRERRIHEIDDVLRECHGLARDLMNRPDTG